jgi:hypothetical protein
MKTVILFGGGDGGGLIITENGVRPIPPFDPAIRLSLKSASSMVNASTEARDERVRGKIAKLATSLCNLAVTQVEQVVGPLDANRSLIFQDDDGGFTCGSTGKPPIPLPWPPRPMPSLPDLIAAGLIETDLIDFVRQARDNQVELTNVFEKPEETAKKLGLTLSKKSVKDLQFLAPSKLAAVKDKTDREIIGFFHKVAKDGRFLDSWYSRPYEVSLALKFKLSDTALERLVAGGAAAAFVDRGGSVAAGPVALVGIAILGIIAVTIAVTSKSVDEMIRDRSDLVKF